MELTTNLKLKKPEATDVVNIDDFNDNADVLDSKLKEIDNEVAATKKSVSDGKTTVAAAITAKGQVTAADAAFAVMAANIGNIETESVLSGTATTAQVLTGATFYNTNPKSKLTGAMTNRGAVSQALAAGGSYTVPAGYHNGSGKVTANTLASQTSATATAATVRTGYTAWVNGGKITGTAATFGAQTITPSTSAQSVATNGKFGTGNITVAAIPSNYVNTQGTALFENGSYGKLADLGAYQSPATTANTTIISGGAITSDAFFRRSIPPVFKKLHITHVVPSGSASLTVTLGNYNAFTAIGSQFTTHTIHLTATSTTTTINLTSTVGTALNFRWISSMGAVPRITQITASA